MSEVKERASSLEMSVESKTIKLRNVDQLDTYR